MIRYDLRCDKGDLFKAWFRNSADYDSQAADGLIACPHCGSVHISKAPMAPAVRTRRTLKANDVQAPQADAERSQSMAMAAKVREHIRDNFDYVGERFAEEARDIHDGGADERPIWGEATPGEARELMEEGVPVAPLPAELAPVPPKKVN